MIELRRSSMFIEAASRHKQSNTVFRSYGASIFYCPLIYKYFVPMGRGRAIIVNTHDAIKSIFLLLLIIGCWSGALAAPPEPGLLFYLSGDREFTADYAAGGDPQPNFLRNVQVISDGARGPGFECANTQLMSYW